MRPYNNPHRKAMRDDNPPVITPFDRRQKEWMEREAKKVNRKRSIAEEEFSAMLDMELPKDHATFRRVILLAAILGQMISDEKNNPKPEPT